MFSDFDNLIAGCKNDSQLLFCDFCNLAGFANNCKIFRSVNNLKTFIGNEVA